MDPIEPSLDWYYIAYHGSKYWRRKRCIFCSGKMHLGVWFSEGSTRAMLLRMEDILVLRLGKTTPLQYSPYRLGILFSGAQLTTSRGLEIYQSSILSIQICINQTASRSMPTSRPMGTLPPTYSVMPPASGRLIRWGLDPASQSKPSKVYISWHPTYVLMLCRMVTVKSIWTKSAD